MTQTKADRLLKWYWVCLSAYLAYAFAFANSSSLVASLLMFVLSCPLLYVALGKLCKKAALSKCAYDRQRLPMSLGFFAASLLLSAAVLGVTWLCRFPGSVSLDTAWQWQQVLDGQYNDWHPVFHTLLMVPWQRLFGLYSVVLGVQLLAFAAALAYFVTVLRSWRVNGLALLGLQTLGLIAPIVRFLLMLRLKDNAMTTGVLVLSAFAVNVFFSRGEWLKKPVNAIALGVTLAYVTLVRHNAFFYTVPFLAVLFLGWQKNWKHCVLTGLVALLCVLGVRGPLYAGLGVAHHDNPLQESIGIPMTIMGNAYMAQREALDEETTAFLERYATREQWQASYQMDDFNSIKFSDAVDASAFESLSQILTMTGRTILRAPHTAISAVNGLTDLVWGLDGRAECSFAPPRCISLDLQCEETYARIRESAPAQLCRVLEKWLQEFCAIPLIRYLTQNIGVQLAILLMSVLVTFAATKRGVLLFALPTLCYALGTMLLLCGNDGRFFQFMMVVSLPLSLVLLFRPTSEKGASEK